MNRTYVKVYSNQANQHRQLSLSSALRWASQPDKKVFVVSDNDWLTGQLPKQEDENIGEFYRQWNEFINSLNIQK